MDNNGNHVNIVDREPGHREELQMPATRTKTKTLIDGGDPAEISKVKELLGYVDGQTTNPSLIAKNPEIRKRVASGHPLSRWEQKEEYKRTVQSIPPLVGDSGVSIEVFADLKTSAEHMLAQGQENVHLDTECVY